MLWTCSPASRAMYNSKDEDERRLWKLFDRLECMVLEKLEFLRQQAAGKSKLDSVFESAARLLDQWEGAFDGIDLHAFAQRLSQLESIDEKNSWQRCWSIPHNRRMSRQCQIKMSQKRLS